MHMMCKGKWLLLEEFAIEQEATDHFRCLLLDCFDWITGGSSAY